MYPKAKTLRLCDMQLRPFNGSNRQRRAPKKKTAVSGGVK
jgi:hypothetical protein